MLKNLRFFFEIFVVCVSLYLIFYFVIFFFLGSSSVDFVISFGFIFLFCIMYMYLKEYVYFYLLLLSKELWVKYDVLLLILNMLNKLIIDFTKNYLSFIEYKTYILYSMEISFDNVLFNVVNELYKKYFLNNVLKQLFFKMKFIYSCDVFLRNFIYFFNKNYYMKLVNIYIVYMLLK